VWYRENEAVLGRRENISIWEHTHSFGVSGAAETHTELELPFRNVRPYFAAGNLDDAQSLP
jgi:hypothetical protein